MTCDGLYYAGYLWSRHVMRLKMPRCQAKMRKSFHSPLLNVCFLLFLLHNHPSLHLLHTTNHILWSTTLTHWGSPMLILAFSLLALNWQSLHRSKRSPQCCSHDVDVADVRNLFVSLIMIPEVFYAKHVMHVWLVLNLCLLQETTNFSIL